MATNFFNNKSDKGPQKSGPMSFAKQARKAATIHMDTPKEKVTRIIASSMIDALNKQLR